MDATKVKKFIAHMAPPVEGQNGVREYIRAAVWALGGRTDADLARTMGLPPATIASWKRRGVIPESGRLWFTTTLAEKIVQHQLRHTNTQAAVARAAVIQVLGRHGGNPFDISGGPLAYAAMFDGLHALAEFMLDTAPDEWGDDGDSVLVERLADLLEGAGMELPVFFR